MTETQKQIKELEDDLKKLVRKADAISILRRGFIQKKAIISFADGCRGLQGWQLGELKNAFGMGVADRMTGLTGKLSNGTFRNIS